MNIRTLLLLGTAVFLAAAVVVVYWSPRDRALRSPEELLQLARESGDAKSIEGAAAELTEYGAAEVERLRVLAREGGTPQARAIGCEALGNAFDYASMDFLFQALDDEAISLRSNAATAIGRMLGRQYPYPANGTAEERAAVVRAMKADWEQLRRDPHLETLQAQLRERH